MTPAQHRQLAKAAARAREAVAHRDDLVRIVRAGGDASLGEIAAAIGFSKPGVQKIIDRGNKVTTQ